MIDTSLISVIIPVFNSSKYLSNSINSIIEQTYKNIEIIIVDDCSTDSSYEIAQNYKSSNIHVFRLPKNVGQCAASNFGIKKSKGNFIKLFDADDLLNKEHIESQYLAIKNSPKSVASAELSRFFNDDIHKSLHEPLQNWQNLTPIDWLLIDNGKGLGMMQCGMFLIPRDILFEAGFWDESLSLINDFEFFPRLLLHSNEIVFTKDAIVYYRSGIINSLSNQLSAKALKSAFVALEKTTELILKFEDSERSRNVLAYYWSLWAYEFYPKQINYFEKAENYIFDLTGAKYKPKLSGLTAKISKLLGWKLTKKLKAISFK